MSVVLRTKAAADIDIIGCVPVKCLSWKLLSGSSNRLRLLFGSEMLLLLQPAYGKMYILNPPLFVCWRPMAAAQVSYMACCLL